MEKEEERKIFRAALGLKEYDIIITEEYSVTSKIMEVLAIENVVKLQHLVLGRHIDLYFPKYRLAVEIDGKGHLDRNEKKKKNKEKTR